MKRSWEYKDMEEVRKARKEVLDREVKEWDSNCVPCQKIPEAIRNGILDNVSSSWKDRKNPICDACPSLPVIRNCGLELEELLNAERAFRLSKGK